MARQFYLAAITVVLLGGLPASIYSSLLLPTNLERSQVATDDSFDIEIEELPWRVFVTYGETTCTGTIIHSNWVLILTSCKIADGIGSDISVYAGGATIDEVRQVSGAEIYRGNDQPDGEFTLLRLKDGLEFDEYVQPARLPRLDLQVLWFVGLAAGFSEKENNKQLMGYITVYNRSLCSSEDFLCTIDDESPTPVHDIQGIDFLEMIEYDDGKKNNYCLIGGRKRVSGSLFEIYHPIVKAVPWLQNAIGLKVVPKPPSSEPDLPAICGFLE